MEEEIRINKIVPVNKMFILATILVVSIVGFLILKTIYNFKTLPQNFPREITVTGEGKAYAKPDIAMINFGVTSEAEKSQDAVSQNSKKMNAAIDSIKNSGVEDKDIKTTFYNLYPLYSYERPPPLYYPSTGNKITGYRLEQQVEIKIRNFDKINEIIDKATSSGANTVGSLQFTVDDQEEVRAEARAKAIEQAKEKAKTLVSGTGLRIVKLISVSDGYYSPIPYGGGYAGVALKEDSVAPRIEPGQTEITTTMVLTYRIK